MYFAVIKMERCRDMIGTVLSCHKTEQAASKKRATLPANLPTEIFRVSKRLTGEKAYTWDLSDK